MTVIEIFTLVLLTFASALCVALIIYLGRITKSVKAMQNNLDQITSDIKPLVTTFSELAEKLAEVTEDVKDQIETSKSIVFSVRDRVDTILDFEERVREGIEQPIFTFTKNLKAISSGVTAFLNYFKK
jgi:uncharacterized protein YoxC